MAAFWLDHGLGKIEAGWSYTSRLEQRLAVWEERSTGATKGYLQNFAIPNSSLLAYLVVIGESVVGLSLLFGLWMKPASWGATFMVINFKFASGSLGSSGFLGDAYFLPVILATILVAYTQSGGSWTVKHFIPQLEKYDF